MESVKLRLNLEKPSPSPSNIPNIFYLHLYAAEPRAKHRALSPISPCIPCVSEWSVVPYW